MYTKFIRQKKNSAQIKKLRKIVHKKIMKKFIREKNCARK